MIKRDFSMWDFVEQKPKIRIQNPWDTTTLNVVDGQYNDLGNITFDNNMFFTTTTLNSDMVWISNLTVDGTAVIPPNIGNVRYDVNGMAVFDGVNWVTIPDNTQIHSEPIKPKLGLWDRTKKFLNIGT